MTAGYVLQTVGINHTSATKAGFITVLYVVLAPAGAALIGRHSPDRVDLLCLGLALAGLGLLSIRDGRLRAGDLIVLAGAAAFAGHIIAVDVLVERYSAVPLALAQMAASAALTAAIAVPAGPQAGDVASLWWIFVLTGVLGSGIAFSVRVMAQQSLSPVRASILLSAEALVAALVGRNLARRAALGPRLGGRDRGARRHRGLGASSAPRRPAPGGLKPWAPSPDKGTYPRSSSCFFAPSGGLRK
jgi:drug/metabolite transporter (DMT)-like permease